MGRRNHVYTQWYVNPHRLRIDASDEGIVDALSSVRMEGGPTHGRLRRILGSARHVPLPDGYHDEGIRLCMAPGFIESPAGIEKEARQLGYRAAGILELLALAKDHRGALMDIDILYGFGECEHDPDDPSLLHVPTLRMSEDGSEVVLDVERVQKNDRWITSPAMSDVRRYFMLVERLRPDYGTCSGCVIAPNTRPTTF